MPEILQPEEQQEQAADSGDAVGVDSVFSAWIFGALVSLVFVFVTTIWFFYRNGPKVRGNGQGVSHDAIGKGQGAHQEAAEQDVAVVPQNKFERVIHAEIRMQEFVLFTWYETKASNPPDTAGASTIGFCQELLQALGIPLHVVDFACIACGTSLANALKTMYGLALHAQQEPVVREEVLFIGGRLFGGFKPLRELLFRGREAMEMTLKSPLDWSHVVVLPGRKDSKGFEVLSATNCLQVIPQEPVKYESKQKADLHRHIQFQTISQLNKWQPMATLRCIVPVAPRQVVTMRRSKLLWLCTVSDESVPANPETFVQGGNTPIHALYPWVYMDTLGYLSNAFVTIPPVSLIIGAHRNGVQVIGAFRLVEVDDNMNRMKRNEILSTLFASPQSAERYALKLHQIAQWHGFDGWFVSIEVDVPSELVARILVFLETLQRPPVKELHNGGIGRNLLVVWNGSLGQDGHIKTQTRLDSDGILFFDRANGFCTADGWSQDDAKFSAALNLDRRFDVYMNIPIGGAFGQNETLGIDQIAPFLRTLWNSGVSAALSMQLPLTIELLKQVHNTLTSNWKRLGAVNDCFGGKNCFYSSFNEGWGEQWFVQGHCELNKSAKRWQDLRQLEVLPNGPSELDLLVNSSTGDAAKRYFPSGAKKGNSWIDVNLSHSMVFDGGSSVEMKGQLAPKQKISIKLFDVDLVFSAGKFMEIMYTSLCDPSSTMLLVLTVCPGLEGRLTHQLVLRSANASDEASGHDSEANRHGEARSVLSKVAGYGLGRHFYDPIFEESYPLTPKQNRGNDNQSAWIRKMFRLGSQLWDAKHVVEVGVLCVTKSQQADSVHHSFHGFLGALAMSTCCSASNPAAIRKGLQAAARLQSDCDNGLRRQDPRMCRNARIISWDRVASTTACLVEWEFDPEGDPVQYVLVYLEGAHGQSSRELVGRSFNTACWIDLGDTSANEEMVVELISVSWMGLHGRDKCRLLLTSERSQFAN